MKVRLYPASANIDALTICNACDSRPMLPSQEVPSAPGYCQQCLDALGERCIGCDEPLPVHPYRVTWDDGSEHQVLYCVDCAADVKAGTCPQLIAIHELGTVGCTCEEGPEDNGRTHDKACPLNTFPIHPFTYGQKL